MTTGTDGLKPFLARIAAGASLEEDEAAEAFTVIMSGEATAAQIGGFLIGLRVRGESVAEITGAARAMRAKALTIDAPRTAIDCCGTGGDGSGSYNISTAVAFVVAAAGVPVAKHGNRALSSRCGAADVLSFLGVNLDADMALVRAALWEACVGFLMAPRHHSAMRHVGPARVELGTRTVFNLLGPLSNPAGARRQLLGVFDGRWIAPLAEVLGQLGAERAWVVHGSDGLDELTTTGPSHVAEWRGGRVRTFAVAPEDVGLPRSAPESLRGGDPAANAAALTAVLEGRPGAYRDIVLLNAAAALVIADVAADLREGVAVAAELVDDGRARAALGKLVEISNRPAAVAP